MLRIAARGLEVPMLRIAVAAISPGNLFVNSRRKTVKFR